MMTRMLRSNPVVAVPVGGGPAIYIPCPKAIMRRGFLPAGVSQVLQGHKKSHRGYVFRRATNREIAAFDCDIGYLAPSEFSPELLAALLTYHPRTGEIRDKRTGKRKGVSTPSGGVTVIVNDKTMWGPRVAWVLHTRQPVPDGLTVRCIDGGIGHYAQRWTNLELCKQEDIRLDESAIDGYS
nr:gp31 [Edwardsiella phage eiDWF]